MPKQHDGLRVIQGDILDPVLPGVPQGKSAGNCSHLQSGQMTKYHIILFVSGWDMGVSFRDPER
jgi:hypothetical protein